jgi:hypothetical protein
MRPREKVEMNDKAGCLAPLERAAAVAQIVRAFVKGSPSFLLFKRPI